MAMNIKQAKIEIANTLKAYLTKDEFGGYLIPTKRQRPVLLMGPPGIGKTQIMEQIANEEKVGLVAYTITHHTRQSAIGLPYILHKKYNGQDVAITEYTMSEILGSVHEVIEKTGQKEGILFLDEINCVSETLTPVMLQFLQYKTFGNMSLPEGWLIVAAGNPPEYNKSAREFDVVTLDRIKRIDVEEDFSVWKEYAYKNHLHGGVVSYLDIKRENFYRIENTIDGMQFATARGWEDLSEVIYAYEKIGISIDRQVVEQYVQMPEVARDFTNYLDLYYKYQSTYHVEEILKGTWEPVTVRNMSTAPFDEKLSVMGLIFSRLSEASRKVRVQDILTERLHIDLKNIIDKRVLSDSYIKEQGLDIVSPSNPDKTIELLEQLISEIRNNIRKGEKSGRLSREEVNLFQLEVNYLEEYSKEYREYGDIERIKALFQNVVSGREKLVNETSKFFDNAFKFLEEAVGQRQEMVIFVTQITAGYDTSWFVENFGCDAYYRHNKDMFYDDIEQRLRSEILE